MATEVSICNMALAHIKSDSTIALLTEKTSEEARKCNMFYTDARDATLEAFNWNFAKRTQVLSETGTAPLGWAYQYAEPSDCIAVRKILTPHRSEDSKVPFEVAHSDINDARVILTDREAAEVEFTKRVTNVNLFSPLFIMAFSHYLGSLIALPLSGKVELQQYNFSQFLLTINMAETSDANQSEKDEEPLPSWLSGR